MPNFKKTLLRLATALAVLAPVCAYASVHDAVSNALDQFALVAHPDAVAPAEQGMLPSQAQVKAPDETAFQSNLPDFDMPALPSTAIAELPAPSVETPLKKIFCAEYARIRSGLAVFGDAKFWWARARTLYARAKSPVENAVMVFTATKRMRLGHVAVVTNIVSKREIRVDQANWQNHGEIDHATPVMDVSAKNDWSQVRVWDMKSGQFGRIYPISGFIFQEMTRQASND